MKLLVSRGRLPLPRSISMLAALLGSAVLANCVSESEVPTPGLDVTPAPSLDATVDGRTSFDADGVESMDASFTDVAVAEVAAADAGVDVMDGAVDDAAIDDAAVDAAVDDASIDGDVADGDVADGDVADADASDADIPDVVVEAATSSPDGGVTVIEAVTDTDNTVVQIAQGQVGAPAIMGCADGQREGLVDHLAYPTMAGCLGEWTGAQDLRATPTGQSCGDDVGLCAVPADLCATGWHMCGASGSVPEVAAMGSDTCDNVGGGRYVTAISHCETQSGCVYDAGGNYACYASGWCSEPVCCGQRCQTFGACPSGVWVSKTHIPVGTDQGCGHITSRRAGGVMCCKD